MKGLNSFHKINGQQTNIKHEKPAYPNISTAAASLSLYHLPSTHYPSRRYLLDLNRSTTRTLALPRSQHQRWRSLSRLSALHSKMWRPSQMIPSMVFGAKVMKCESCHCWIQYCGYGATAYGLKFLSSTCSGSFCSLLAE
jgi:hypothetical protein